MPPRKKLKKRIELIEALGKNIGGLSKEGKMDIQRMRRKLNKKG